MSTESEGKGAEALSRLEAAISRCVVDAVFIVRTNSSTLERRNAGEYTLTCDRWNAGFQHRTEQTPRRVDGKVLSFTGIDRLCLDSHEASMCSAK